MPHHAHVLNVGVPRHHVQHCRSPARPGCLGRVAGVGCRWAVLSAFSYAPTRRKSLFCSRMALNGRWQPLVCPGPCCPVWASGWQLTRACLGLVLVPLPFLGPGFFCMLGCLGSGKVVTSCTPAPLGALTWPYVSAGTCVLLVHT